MNILRRLIKPFILCLCVVVVGYAFIHAGNRRDKLVYAEHLDDIVATIDGAEITFRDLAFYILYEERVIENEARIYNPDSTKDYWNIHTNDTFIQEEAKKVIIEMVIHDRLFYQLALDEGMDTLSDDELQELEYARTDFWEDLLDVQWTLLPCSEAEINSQMDVMAVAEKYQNYLYESQGPSQAAYKYDGYYYGLIKEEHDIQINDELWDRFVVGDITLVHNGVNYINGLTDAEKEEK